jgi:hypothetical protein
VIKLACYRTLAKPAEAWVLPEVEEAEDDVPEEGLVKRGEAYLAGSKGEAVMMGSRRAMLRWRGW